MTMSCGVRSDSSQLSATWRSRSEMWMQIMTDNNNKNNKGEDDKSQRLPAALWQFNFQSLNSTWIFFPPLHLWHACTQPAQIRTRPHKGCWTFTWGRREMHQITRPWFIYLFIYYSLLMMKASRAWAEWSSSAYGAAATRNVSPPCAHIHPHHHRFNIIWTNERVPESDTDQNFASAEKKNSLLLIRNHRNPLSASTWQFYSLNNFL